MGNGFNADGEGTCIVYLADDVTALAAVPTPGTT